MSTTTAYPAGLLGALKRELGAIDKRISQDMEYRAAIQHLIELHEQFHQHDTVQAPHLRAVARPEPAPTPAASHDEDGVPISDGEEPELPDSAPSTVEMAKIVLGNAQGQPLGLLAIKEAIRQTFGIEPAKTLDQMLYKRAQRGKGFYKTKDGEFGLLEAKPEQRVGAAVVETVGMPSTALA